MQSYKLPARYVIHTVGPVWHGGANDEAELLASCYQRSLALAESVSARSVAFLSISTGVYRYPIEEAARIAISTVSEVLKQGSTVESVTFCCFSSQDLAVYEVCLDQLKL